MGRKSLWLIDGHAQIFRAYYAPFQRLNAPTGEPTKATYVFSQMLLNLIRDKKPDYLAMVMDVSDATVFRVQIDASYKANRQPSPEDLGPQIDRIVEIVQAMQVPILRESGFEADDLIATICARLRNEDVDVVIVSRDKDLDQLISDKVRMYDPLSDAFTDAASMLAEKGYGPDKAIEAQTLMGDSTDNVRGIDGVGPKKAAELLAKYGDVAGVIANVEKLTPKLRERVREFAARADITRRLVTLRQDVPFAFELGLSDVERFRLADARPIFQKLGFNRLQEQLPAATVDAAAASGNAAESESALSGTLSMHVEAGAAKTSSHLVDSEAALDELANRLSRCAMFAFDTETTGLMPVDADLVGISVALDAGSGYYVPTMGFGRTLSPELVRAKLGPIFANRKIRKCGQNAKFDIGVLRTAGIEVAGLDFDSMVASFVLDSSRRSHGIDGLAQDLLGFTKIPTTDLIGKGKDQITFDRLPPGDVCAYASEDADIALRLRLLLEKQLAASPLKRLFDEVEMPLVEVLAEMEHNGIALDTDLLGRLGNEMAAESAELSHQIHDAVGYPFNIDSTKQLAEVLFDKLKLPVVKRTKTGRSTDAEVLEELAETTKHPVPRLVQAYRELAKLKGTYVDTLPEMVSRRTGRVHPSFHQTVAVTGRLSCSDPNIQNIPIRTPAGAKIRRAFVAGGPDQVLLKADYSQIELRVLAHFCGDETLRKAFEEDQDIHAFVAGQLFGAAPSDVTKEQRGRAKTVNFGIIYGQSAFGLARQTGMGRGEAQEFINRYFERYPRIRAFLDHCITHAREHGFVETILGRRRRIDDIHSRNPAARAAAERFAVNSVVQGSAADLIKKAMIDIYAKLRGKPEVARLLLQVHDELVFEMPKSGVARQAEMIRSAMATAIPLAVPVKVDIAAGPNWLDTELVKSSRRA